MNWAEEIKYYKLTELEIIAIDWLKFRLSDVSWIVPHAFTGSYGTTIGFDYSWGVPQSINKIDLTKYFITVPMVEQLKNGTNPKNVVNKFMQK